VKAYAIKNGQCKNTQSFSSRSFGSKKPPSPYLSFNKNGKAKTIGKVKRGYPVEIKKGNS
jgi:hypothetical protein